MKTELDFTATKSHPKKINSPRCPFIYDDFQAHVEYEEPKVRLNCIRNMICKDFIDNI